MRNTADVIGGKPIAALLQYISGESAINPLVIFYDIHGRKREVLCFYFVPDTPRDVLQYSIFQFNRLKISASTLSCNISLEQTLALQGKKSIKKGIKLASRPARHQQWVFWAHIRVLRRSVAS
jgi:hypothetical protein